MIRALLPLSGLRAFEAAARHLSFARAASELHVTPAAISHLVRTLEGNVGAKLFRRAQRRIFLTDAGQRLLPDLREGFDRLESGYARLRGTDAARPLTVTLSPAFAAKWLLPRLDHFRARHPDIDVRIDANVRLVDFASEEIDIAIRYGRGRWPGLSATLLFSEDVFPVCSPRLMRGRNALRSPRDFGRVTLLHDETIDFDADFPTWRSWLKLAKVAGVDAERGLRFSSSVMATQAAIDGQGVALGRSVIVADDLAAGRLVRPFDVACPLDLGYHLVHPPQTVSRPNVAAFRAWILAEAGAHAS